MPALQNLRKHCKYLKNLLTFYLTVHNNGQFCKKMQKIHFFSVWDNPQDAMDKILRVFQAFAQAINHGTKA